MILTYNFKMEPYNYEIDERFSGKYQDMRNGIECIAPTADIECYLNYIELLNLHRNKWKSYGYLDLGMMPFVMAPSFLHASLIDPLVSIANEYGIQVINMPPVSLLCEKCKVTEEDIWVFKSDVAELTKIPEAEITLERLIRWCMR